MKKYIIFLLALFTLSFVHAQVNKYQIKIDDNLQFFLNIGCNNIFGDLKNKQISSTKNFCSKLQKEENDIIYKLKSFRYLKKENNKIYLFDNNNIIIFIFDIIKI